MALSKRAMIWAQPDDGMLIWKIIVNLWHPQNNPDGYVSLGVAENTLMHDTLSQHIKAYLNPPNHAFTYGDGPRGTVRLKSAMARFLTKHLKPLKAIEPSHICITNGCTSALEHLAFLFANPGEHFLLGQPHYGAFPNDFSLRSETFVTRVTFGDIDPLGLDAVRVYEDAILDAQRNHTKIAGLILCNPHNPLGRCYSREALIGLMRLCEKYQIHLISDEIYALSVWENTVDRNTQPNEFISCLSFDTTGIIDPALIHVVWGTSKDFGANGLRLAAIISQHNQTLHNALVPVSLYSSASSLAEHATADILEDDEWVEDYLAENRRKLSKNYELVTTWAKKHNITYVPGVTAAFFLWVDLGTVYQAQNPERQIKDATAEVMDALLQEKVFLASGKAFGSEKPGWFRIVFSHPPEFVEEGLSRVVKAIGIDNSKEGMESKL